MKPDWVALLPLILLSGGGFLILCIGAFWKKHPSTLLYGIALVTVFLVGDLAVFWPAQTPHFLNQLEAGGFGRYFTFLIALITGISLLFSRQYAETRKFDGDEFYGLTLLAAAGMILVAGAIHWLTFFLGLEVLSLSLYVIIAIRKEEAASNEAGIKYFIMGAMASAFLTFGIALIYAVTGELDIARSLAVGVPAGNRSLILMGFSLVLVGVGFKISMVPFHLWTPDVYQGAPAPVTAFLSTGSKVALFAALLRFAFYAGNDLWAYMVPVMWILAVLTMVVGNVSALSQYQAKRLLAYSSVAQMGYLLMTLLAIKQTGAGAIMFYLAVYALMDLGAFGTLATLSAERGDLDHLDDFRGLGYSHPWRSAVLATSLFCLAGIPPTAGFIGKFALFWAVLHSGYILLPVIGILTVIVSIYFYIKVIVALYMRPAEEKIPVPFSSLSGGFAGGIVLILILWLGLAPEPVFAVITNAFPFLSSP